MTDQFLTDAQIAAIEAASQATAALQAQIQAATATFNKSKKPADLQLVLSLGEQSSSLFKRVYAETLAGFETEAIAAELQADYEAEAAAMASFKADEAAHVSAIRAKLRDLFTAGCRIALLNPADHASEFTLRISTAHDQLMLQAPTYGGLFSDIYSVLEADEFSLRRYAPAPGKRFSLAAAAYVRRALYKFAFGHRLGLESSENASPLHDSSLTSENTATLPKSANTSTLAPDDDAHFLTTHVALMDNKAEIGTVLTQEPL